MSTTSSILTAKLTLKLVIDKKNNKVVFAEAGNDFVNFLYSIPSVPLGTLLTLLTPNDQNGQRSIRNISHSGDQVFSDTFMRPNQTKETILTPECQLYFAGKTIYLTGDKFATKSSRKLYGCSDHCLKSVHGHVVADDPESTCPCCGYKMDYPATLVSNSGESGFVKGAATYMVTDDLEVQPMSGILVINLLNELKIPAADVEEKVVEFGLNEGMLLVVGFLQGKTVLTKVFL